MTSKINVHSKPLFSSNRLALAHYEAEAKKLESKHGKTLKELFKESEASSKWNEELSEIHTLYNRINVLKLMIKDRHG